jgi:hypothetical protein
MDQAKSPPGYYRMPATLLTESFRYLEGRSQEDAYHMLKAAHGLGLLVDGSVKGCLSKSHMLKASRMAWGDDYRTPTSAALKKTVVGFIIDMLDQDVGSTENAELVANGLPADEFEEDDFASAQEHFSDDEEVYDGSAALLLLRDTSS